MDEQNNGMDAEVLPLDDAAIETIAELKAQERDIQTSMRTVLAYFLRQHKVQGNWGLRMEGPGAFKELVRQPDMAPARPQA